MLNITSVLEKQFDTTPHLGKYLPDSHIPKNAGSFASSLNEFYKSNQLELEQSPFLTTRFRRLLNLPGIAIVAHDNTARFFPNPTSAACSEVPNQSLTYLK